MRQAAEDGLTKWIGAAEVALLENVEEATAERFAGLAAGLLRHCPEKLWDLLREASKEELDEVPELENLLERLTERLVGVGRLEEAGDFLKAARHWEVGLADSVYRQLAQAQMLSGETASAEETVRGLLKRDPADFEALRLLYRLLGLTGRTAEAHDVLSRLVELDPS